jgi:WD40 repeat protein
VSAAFTVVNGSAGSSIITIARRDETPDSVFGLAFSTDGRLIAAGQLDGVSLWDASTTKLPRETRLGPVDSVAFTADGSLLAAGTGEGRIVLIDVRNGNQF